MVQWSKKREKDRRIFAWILGRACERNVWTVKGVPLQTFAAVSQSEEKRRRCLLLLPLCPVYGLGMLAALALPPMGWLGVTVLGGLAATAVEKRRCMKKRFSVWMRWLGLV